MSHELHCDERHKHRHGDDETCHDCCSPIAQEEPDNESREQESDDDGITHTLNRLGHDVRLVVERLNLHTGRKARTDRLHLVVNFIGDFDRVAVRLPADAQQHRWFAIRAHNRVHRRDCGPDCAHITDAHRNVVGGFDDDGPDLFRTAHLSIHETEKQLVIPAHQPGGVDDVRVIDRTENVIDRDPRAQHLRGIDRHMKFGLLPSLDDNPPHAAQSIEPRLDVVRRKLPQIRLRNFIGREAVADDGETRKIHPIRFNFRCRRKAALDARHGGVDHLQRLDHVDIPVEEEIDVG